MAAIAHTLTDTMLNADLQRSARTPSLTDSEPSRWEWSVLGQLQRLLQLEKGWDGYGSGRIRTDVLFFAAELLYRTMLRDTPAPHITPMSHEGVMLEWHESGIDLEIEIEAPGHLWVTYADAAQGIDEEWSLKADFVSLSEPIYNLTSRSAPQRAS